MTYKASYFLKYPFVYYRNIYGKYFLEESLRGADSAKMTYLSALSFCGLDVMDRVKAAILDCEVIFMINAQLSEQRGYCSADEYKTTKEV